VGKLDDGRTVFVPRTAPGDLVELTELREHSRFARARLARVVEPGPGRVVPRCAHYLGQDCGGCQFQHLDQATQLDAKRAIVQDALVRIGRLELDVPPVIAGDEPWSYRTRITLAIGPGRRFAGFHPLDEAGRVFDLESCAIAAPPLMRLWVALRPALHLLPPDVQQLVLRLDRDGNLHLLVKAAGDQVWARAKRLGEILLAHQVSATVWWQPERGASRVVAGAPDAFPATVFEQVHPALGDRIRIWGLAQLGTLSGVHVWDLYSGIGETTTELSLRGATVESVELDPRAVDTATRRWGGPAETVTRHVGRVEDLVGRLRDPAAVILNPPRAGTTGGVIDAIRARRPQRVVYISCDPATLARDLRRLCEPAAPPLYRPCAVQPFDLFPQTAHVETVAVVEAG
jgi:23S rRNA (uracil1939-C5)-methyltransferase